MPTPTPRAASPAARPAPEALDDFGRSFDGQLLLPDSPGYDEARTIWNGMIDRRPGAVARCLTAGDVVQAVRFSAEQGALVSVRGGGHNIAGNAVCDGGLTIDLSPMRGVHVNPEARTARVEPGATLGDVDRATQAFGLATPLGINSTTGVAGLTLGGGFGWLSRKHGMTVDNLRSVEIVTAGGERLVASGIENEDLFWAVRGGGGNFGVVTTFEFELHEVGPQVTAGLVVHPLDRALDVLSAYRTLVDGAPDELSCWFVIRKAPPLPFLPEEAHGTEVLVLAMLYAGGLEEGDLATVPLRAIGDPIADVVGPRPYAEFQTAFDPLLEPGARNYWKSHNLPALTDELLETVVEYGGRLPSPDCEIFVAHLGGAASRVPPEATAYPHRDASFVMNVHGRWEKPGDDGRCISWTRDLFEATAPDATGGVYVNFLTRDEGDRVRHAYGPNYDRLVEMKDLYDPENLFRMNQNIRPSGKGAPPGGG